MFLTGLGLTSRGIGGGQVGRLTFPDRQLFRILLRGLCVADWHEEAWARALRDLGHSVEIYPMVRSLLTQLERLRIRLKSGLMV